MSNAPSSDQAYVLDHSVKMIDGTEMPLEHFKGKVILMVNVASECGYTRQYEGLEALYRTYMDQGLVIIGFPANDFGGQEPGTNEEIAEFCSSRFSVTFPMAAKVAVLGDQATPLYTQLADQPKPIGGEPQWNFTKFLVARDGRVVERFGTKVEPDDSSLVSSIEAQLGQG